MREDAPWYVNQSDLGKALQYFYVTCRESRPGFHDPRIAPTRVSRCPLNPSQNLPTVEDEKFIQPCDAHLAEDDRSESKNTAVQGKEIQGNNSNQGA
jgi:hypothetical protein